MTIPRERGSETSETLQATGSRAAWHDMASPSVAIPPVTPSVASL
jgi:hypothetical protein